MAGSEHMDNVAADLCLNSEKKIEKKSPTRIGNIS